MNEKTINSLIKDITIMNKEVDLLEEGILYSDNLERIKKKMNAALMNRALLDALREIDNKNQWDYL